MDMNLWKLGVAALILLQCAPAQADNSPQNNVIWEQPLANTPITGGAITTATLSRGSVAVGASMLVVAVLAIAGFKMHHAIKWMGSPAKQGGEQ